MSGTILVRGARQLLTLHGPRAPRRGPALSELGIIDDGAVLIEDGRIIEVGPSRRVENLTKARGAEEIDATGRVVMPGFVDCHTHLVCGHPWLDDFEARIAGRNEPAHGPSSSVSAVRQASTARLETHARHLIDAMVRHGTTTLEAKSGYGLDETGELKILRAQIRLHRTPLDVVSTFLIAPNGGGAEYLGWVCSQLMPKVWSRGLARYADFHSDSRHFDVTQAIRYLEAAQRLGFRLKIHSGEDGPDGAVGLAVTLEATSADHLDYTIPADVQRLARSNTIAVLLPGYAFELGRDRRAPARSLVNAGAAVALATGFHPHASPLLSMQMAVALACRRLHLSPAEAICASTFNAACAIGCAETAGSLEVGKPADLIVLNATDYREISYYFGVNLVCMTVKRGKLIYDERRGGSTRRNPAPIS